MEILARADSSAATHGFVEALREMEIRFSVGFDLTAPVREAILAMPETPWRTATTQEGSEREGAAVCELNGLDLSAWPEGTRAICRRERPHPGAQLTFSDLEGHRFQVFITDQQDPDIVALDARHRAHARVEDRIRCAKESGLRNFPFHDFGANQVWLELVLAAQNLVSFFQRLCLTGEAQLWEPKKLRYRLLHVGARLVRSGRRLILRLQRAGRARSRSCRPISRPAHLPIAARILRPGCRRNLRTCERRRRARRGGEATGIRGPLPLDESARTYLGGPGATFERHWSAASASCAGQRRTAGRQPHLASYS